jgi:uncharacterized tellurite resistance protein B-like protein
MLQQWLKHLQTKDTTQSPSDEFWFERVSALLLVEISRADSEIDDTELSTIAEAIKSSSHSIDSAEIDEIIASAKQDSDNTISFREHVRLINKNCSREQKLSLIEQMWRVAYADGDLDKYEEYTIRKLADLLYVEHQELIKAKLRVSGQ